MRELEIHAWGTPAPQGSFFAILVRGRPQVVADNKATAPWRKAVVAAARNAMRANPDWLPSNEAVRVDVVFLLARPKTVKRERPSTRPDIDKLVRSTLDALQASGAITEDGRICELRAEKRYARSGQPTGAVVRVVELAEVLV